MPSLIERSCLLLLALPALAVADPFTVVTHSTGIASVNPTVLYALGQDESPAEYELPYELTLTSTFDWNDPLPARDDSASQYDAEVTVDFRMGDLDYHYAGRGWSTVSLYTPSSLGGDAYWHETWIVPNPGSYGYSFNVEQALRGPAGSMGPGGALTPGIIESGGSADGYVGITAYYSNDEYTFLFPMSGEVASFSVQVTSPVPEPASFGLLAVGMLILGLRRRLVEPFPAQAPGTAGTSSVIPPGAHARTDVDDQSQDQKPGTAMKLA